MRKALGQLYFKLAGWRTEGETPRSPKCIVIASPHTSNWDLLYMIAAAWVYEIDFRWLGKREIFNAPFGRVMRWLGGVPVDRSKNNSLVDQIVERFEKSDRLMLIVPPSGTRSRRDHWKSGFYHMALGAGVPVVPGFLDYEGKRAGFGAEITLTGDLAVDMEVFRAFYADKRGKYPQNETPQVLRSELADESKSGDPAS